MGLIFGGELDVPPTSRTSTYSCNLYTMQRLLLACGCLAHNTSDPSTFHGFAPRSALVCVIMLCCSTVEPNARAVSVNCEAKLFVGMVPHDADNMTLAKVFSGFGEITEVSRCSPVSSAPHEECPAYAFFTTL